MNPISILLAAVAAVNALFLGIWASAIYVLWTDRNRARSLPNPEHVTVGFLTSFFDTLGIGSYAPTTAWYRLRKLVDDRVIPGTMSVGHAPAVLVQTVIYTTIVPVDPVTLFSMIVSATIGAFLGAGIVSRLPKQKIQISMGFLLIAAAILMFLSTGGPLKQLTGVDILPAGGNELGVTGFKLAIAVTVNFVLGALMTLGIGLYAPCMITVLLLGMNPTVAFPIMMGSCAFLMPTAAIRFIKQKSYDNRAAVGLMIGGVPAVFAAAYIVVSMDVSSMKWLVVLVVTYAAVTLLRSGFERKESP